MKLLQLTDIHLTNPGATIGGRDPNANFDRALSHAVTHHPDAEALVITGDLSDWGDREDYLRLRSRLETVDLPVHLAIGNHDDRPSFLEVFPELADSNGFVQKVFPLSMGTGVILDTWGPETHAGHFCETRKQWLDEALTDADGPCWLFLHHNPAPTHIKAMDEIMLLDAERLGVSVAAHRSSIAHIFHGHCHLPLAGSFHGVPTSAPRGTNHAGWPDFSGKNILSSSDLPEAYAVIFANAASVTVQMVEYGYEGQIRVEGSPDYKSWVRAANSR